MAFPVPRSPTPCPLSTDFNGKKSSLPGLHVRWIGPLPLEASQPPGSLSLTALTHAAAAAAAPQPSYTAVTVGSGAGAGIHPMTWPPGRSMKPVVVTFRRASHT